MPTYQGQVSEEGLIDLVEYIKNLNSNYRIQQTLNTTQVSPAQTGAIGHGSASCRARDGEAMSTIVNLPDQATASMPKVNYLNKEYGIKSWLLTGDHKRIAMLYLDLDHVLLLHRRRVGRPHPPGAAHPAAAT